MVGVSHSCDYPPGVRRLPAMTSTGVPHTESSDVIDSYVRGHLADNSALYDLNMQSLAAAAPDFIVSQALCDVCAVSTGDIIAALGTLPSKPELIDLEPNTLDEVLNDCQRVGASLGCAAMAEKIVDDLRTRRSVVAARTAGIGREDLPSVAFLEWLLPPFNGGHWNPELVALAGGVDILGMPGKPSSSLIWKKVASSKPEILFIACCGFSKDRALADLRVVLEQKICRSMPAVKRGKVFIADGNAYFSRPGPRLLDGLEMMAHAFHPDVHPASQHGSCDRVVLQDVVDNDLRFACRSGRSPPKKCFVTAERVADRQKQNHHAQQSRRLLRRSGTQT